MNRRKLLKRLSQGAFINVPFLDMKGLILGFGFNLVRVTGSHHIFKHPNVSEMINIQEVKGEAKPYQIRQFLKLVERYNLKIEDDQ